MRDNLGGDGQHKPIGIGPRSLRSMINHDLHRNRIGAIRTVELKQLCTDCVLRSLPKRPSYRPNRAHQSYGAGVIDGIADWNIPFSDLVIWDGPKSARVLHRSHADISQVLQLAKRYTG